MKKGIYVFISIISILILINIFSPKESYGYTEYTYVIDGIEWHYCLNESNEAINVYAKFNSTNANIETVTIPSKIGQYSVVSIGKYPYYEYNIFGNTRDEQIKKVIIPNSVKEIKRYCFINCMALETVEMPDSIETIGSKAFYHCEKLKSAEFKLPQNLINIEDYAFHSCYNLDIKDIEFPANLKNIGNYAFYNCKSLTGNLNLPNTLQTIGRKAFANCSELNGTITIGSGITNIPEKAFQNCSKLTGNLTIPNTVTEIGEWAFSGCEGLNGELNYNSTCANIKDFTFSNCNFSKIKLPSTVTQIGILAFNNAKEIWIDNTEGNVIFANTWGGIGGIPYVHYKDCKHTITILAPEGVKVIDTITNTEITTGEYSCSQALNLIVKPEDISKYAYLNMLVKTDGKYTNSPKEEEKVDLLDNPTYTQNIQSLTRNKQIIITGQDIKLVDLKLIQREYISEINGTEPTNKREPIITNTENKLEYKHTKYPVEVQNGDTITYKIRVYNEGENEGYAKEIVQYIGQGLEFDVNNANNIKYKWTVSEDGRKITTTYLENTAIPAYTNNENPSYEEIEFICKVTAEKQLEEDIRLVVAGEITKGTSGEKELKKGNLSIPELSTYKEEEAYNSNSTQYVRGTEEDDDFENVVIKREIPIDYTIRIEKIDSETEDMLNGAKFDLLNEDKEVIKTGITKNGGILDFGLMKTHGTQDDIYYIKETETPEGYRKIIQDEVKVVIHKKITDPITEQYEISIECDLLETKVIVETQDTVIPIYTEEQLSKIGTNRSVTIDGKTYTFGKYEDYELKNDIKITSENWKPIKEFGGVFDGAGYTISNLKITQDGDSDNTRFGLFAEVSGTIKDLNVSNININITNVEKEINEKISDARLELANATTTTEKTRLREKIKELQEKLENKYNVGGIVAYMAQGTLQNCTVSGTINSDTNNVGGLIGYGADGKLLIINGCTNNTNITATGSKIGGLIGVGFGALSIVDSTNNGTIIAGKFNAGGLVGYSEASNYSVNNVVVKLDKTTNIVSLTIENKRHIGEYTLSLKNIDIDTYELLDGARFKVLDKNKQVITGYEDIEVKNGALQIATYDIEELGTDTYYVVQTKTPDGYVDVTEYVKVTISKVWNGKEEKYEVAVNITVINKDDYEDEENIDDSHSDSRTDKKYVIKEAENVEWKVNKIYVKNCTNNGAVKSGLDNTAGIIGCTKCIAELENCTNTGEITPNYNTTNYSGHASGMIAQAQKQDDSTEIRLTGCINEGIITSQTGVSDAAGLVSYTVVPVIVNNCKNTANIGSENLNVQTIAGFIATADADITIKNSINTGNITANNSIESAGFLAKEINTNSTIEIENCENSGNVTGGGKVSAFIGIGINKKTIINNSKIIGTQENPVIFSSTGYTGELGGYICLTTSDLNINNCKSENIEINVKNSGYASIMVGEVASLGYTIGNDKIGIIKNCTANNIEIQREQTSSPIEFGGIICKIITGQIKDLKIENCEINNMKFNENMSESTIGGMLGLTYAVDNINLVNNKITNSILLSNNTSDSTRMGGIASTILNCGETLNIENCNIENTQLKSDRGNYIGGILGRLDNSYNAKINIIGCNVNKTEIYSGNDSNKIGGIVGGILSGEYANIIKCNYNESTIISDDKNTSKVAIGGIVGFTDVTANFEDCTIINSDIKAKAGYIGGILSQNVKYYYGNATELKLENCKVINTSMKREKVENSYAEPGNMGGLVSTIVSLPTTIKNCIVTSENRTKEISGNQNLGGLIGFCNSEIKIENTEFSNMIIKSSTTDGNQTGGAIGVNGGNANIKGLRINNIKIDSPGGIGGVWGCQNREATIEDSEINNLEITHKATTGYMPSLIGGVVGAANKLTVNNTTVKNVKMDGTDINTMHMAGVVAVGSENVNIFNSNISKINMKNNSANSGAVPITSGVISIARTEAKLENINVNDIEIESKGHAAGLSGSGDIVTNENNGNIEISKIRINIKTTEGAAQGVMPLASMAAGTTNGTIKNIKATDGIITINSNLNVLAGGILGIGKTSIDNCEVNKLDITSKTSNGNAVQIGGIAGGCDKAVSNSKANDISINSSSVENIIAGGIGYISGNAENIQVTNLKIIANGKDDTKSAIGGILGIQSGEITLNSSSIEDGTIKASKAKCVGGAVGVCSSGNITNVDTNSVTIINDTEGSTTAGIIAATANPSTEIQNCNLTSSSITNAGNKYTVDSTTGVKIYQGGTAGILGVGTGLISECTVKNSNIVSKEETSYGTGGIVGHGNNIKNQATAIDNCKVINTCIEGKTAVGGIAGAAVANITDCLVQGNKDEENSALIIGEDKVGGILGFAGQLTTEPNLVRLAAKLTKCVIQDVKIVGKTLVKEAIGGSSYYTEGETTEYDANESFVNSRSVIEVK